MKILSNKLSQMGSFPMSEPKIFGKNYITCFAHFATSPYLAHDVKLSCHRDMSRRRVSRKRWTKFIVAKGNWLILEICFSFLVLDLIQWRKLTGISWFSFTIRGEQAAKETSQGWAARKQPSTFVSFLLHPTDSRKERMWCYSCWP